MKLGNAEGQHLFGSHLSIAGGLHNALISAKGYGFECVQVFTKNQRQWKCSPLTDAQIRDWQAHQKDTGITDVVSHDSYLINLGSPGGELREKSIATFREEIERCEALGIAHLVTHPGAHVGEGEAAGLARIVQAIDQVHAELPGYRTITCLENTAGQGSSLGYDLRHLRAIMDAVKQPERLGVCIDTAHSLEAGYDLTSAAGAKAFLKELDNVVGLEHVRVIHVNDSKTPRGSRVDRHAHIGHGHVSLEAFRVILRHKAFRRTPKVLETPKEKDEKGRDWDEVNVRTLRDLLKKR